jgi:RNA polymerase sigma-70 factor (ECF subfamily)
VRCGEEAEDLMQELWIKIQQVETPVERALPYIYRMAHRLVLDSRRGASRARDRDYAWSFATGRLDDAETAMAERALIAREQLDRIDRTLSKLGARAARVFRRYRIDGVEQRRIAVELGVSISTVESDLRRSYTALSSLMGERDDA